MPEDRENESLPYPKMDIEFHRKDENFHGIRYIDDITARIHLLVKYRCCFCGAENRDDTQVYQKVMKIISVGNPQTRIEKETEAVKELKAWEETDAAAEIELNIIPRQYKKLGLRCSCARCGTKQPWSNFRQAGDIVNFNLVRTFFMLVFAARCVLGPRFKEEPNNIYLFKWTIFAGVIVFLLVPAVVEAVHNRHAQRKSLKLEEEYRPEISIVYKSEEQPEEDI